MTIDNQTGLVLEGGGMRGVFTCGVLDYLMTMIFVFPIQSGSLRELATGFRICLASVDGPSTVTSTC